MFSEHAEHGLTTMKIWDYMAGINGILLAGALLLGGLLVGVKWVTPMMGRALIVTSNIREADAIIVLGDALWDGTLSERTLRRTVFAIQLHNRGLAKHLVFSGGGGSEASLKRMRDLAIDLGVPRENTILDTESTSLKVNADSVQEIFARRNWRSALLVTSPWQMQRAVAVFSRNDLIIYEAPIIFFESFADSFREDVVLMEAVIPEYLSRAYYRWKGWM
ncbi:MAG: YdcF family protein [Candidatus Latescibacteria bacterium]|jgi:uncharacterized SAM-binding protein YcdF (DUF218 family)|nr:YdcF family protein [Candidatus Latescibacterota bacterium]